MATAVQSTVSQASVNAAFLQEIKEVHQELWQLLANIREVCSSVWMVRQHTAQFVHMLTELRDQLALHFALEEAYGYFENAAGSPPAASERASHLRAEHRRLYILATQLAELAEQLHFEENYADIVTILPIRFNLMDQELMQHESRANDLIMGQLDDPYIDD